MSSMIWKLLFFLIWFFKFIVWNHYNISEKFRYVTLYFFEKKKKIKKKSEDHQKKKPLFW